MPAQQPAHPALPTPPIDALPLLWHPREPPLPASAALAHGTVITALRRRLLALDDHALHCLRGVVGDDVWVLLGDTAQLPWVDGLLYLGVDPTAPGLWQPTLLAAQLPSAWLADLFAAERPCALWPERQWIIPLADARPLTRSHLQALP